MFLFLPKWTRILVPSSSFYAQYWAFPCVMPWNRSDAWNALNQALPWTGPSAGLSPSRKKKSGAYIREFKRGFDLHYELLLVYCWRQNTDSSQLLKAAIRQKRRNHRTVMKYLFHLFMDRTATGFDCKEL